MTSTAALLGQQVVKNSLSVLLRGLVQAGFVIVVTPFILHRLGAEEFGAWSLIYVFLAYSMLFDFGISGAFAKFAAGVDPGRAPGQIRGLLYSAMGLLTVLLLVVTGGAIACAIQYGDRPVGHHTLWELFPLIAVLFWAAMLSNLFNFALIGIQRQDLSSFVSIFFIVLSGIGTVVVLEAGLKLKGLIVLNAFSALAMGATSWALFSSRVQRGSLTPVRPSNWMKLLRFGGLLQIYALVTVFYYSLGKFLITYYVSLAAVSQYEVALRLVTLVRQGLGSVASPLMPAAARLHSDGETSAISRFCFSTVKHVSLLGLPAFIALGVFAGPILKFWIGGDCQTSVVVLQGLVPGFYAGTLSTVVWFFLVGTGRPGLGVVLSVAETILGVAATIVLTRIYGIAGTAWGASLAACLSMPVYFWLYRRQVSYPLGRLVWEGVAYPSALCCLLAVPVYSLLTAVPSGLPQAVFAVLYVLACYVGFLLLGIVGKDERSLVKSWLGLRWRTALRRAA